MATKKPADISRPKNLPIPPAKTDAIEKTKTTTLSTEVVDLEQYSGVGMENVTSQDLQIPRIAILQSGSPQIKKSEAEYIKGAEGGDFFHNVSNSVLATSEDGFFFIPVNYESKFIEWIPKKAGGGFCGTHDLNSGILSKTKKDSDGHDLLPNGHEIVLTGEWYCLVWKKDGNPEPALISFAKTQFKKCKNLNSQLNLLRFAGKKGPYNPPPFASYFLVTAVPESNDKGNWMGWKFERAGNTASLDNGNDLIQEALVLIDGVKAGTVKVADPAADAGVGSGTPEDGATL